MPPYYEPTNMLLAPRIAVCALVAALANGGCESRGNARIQPKAAPQSMQLAAPAASGTPQLEAEPADGLKAIDGPSLMAEIKKTGRKATLLNVWASWCGSCKRELPMLVDLASALEPENVGVMFVSVDTPEARPAAAELLATLEPRPTSWIAKGSLGPFKRAVNPSWKGALPATALYDEHGELLWFWPGPVLEHEISTIVTAHLAGQPLEGPTLVEPDPPQ